LELPFTLVNSTFTAEIVGSLLVAVAVHIQGYPQVQAPDRSVVAPEIPPLVQVLELPLGPQEEVVPLVETAPQAEVLQASQP